MSFSLTMTRGDERQLEFVVTNPDSTSTDLTGKALTFTAKRSVRGAVIFTKTIGSGITVTSAALGTATLLISPSDTSGFVDQVLLHCDLQMDNNPGSPKTIADGTITVVPDITVP